MSISPFQSLGYLRKSSKYNNTIFPIHRKFIHSVLYFEQMGRHMTLACKQNKRRRQKLARKLKCARKLKFQQVIPEQSSEKVLLSAPCSSQFISDHHGSEIAGIPTPPITPLYLQNAKVLSTDDGESDSDLFPHLYDKQEKEAERIRECQKNKDLVKEQKYGAFVDDTVGITGSNKSLCPISILKKLPPIDRAIVNNYIEEWKKKAVFMAQCYRDQSSRLQKESLEDRAKAYEEKEGVRYFWRNQVLEGCSTSGKILNMALLKNRK